MLLLRQLRSVRLSQCEEGGGHAELGSPHFHAHPHIFLLDITKTLPCLLAVSVPTVRFPVQLSATLRQRAQLSCSPYLRPSRRVAEQLLQLRKRSERVLNSACYIRPQHQQGYHR